MRKSSSLSSPSSSSMKKAGEQTMRPIRYDPGSKQDTLSKRARASLGVGNMRSAVKLAPGDDLREWLAVNTVDFYNEIGILWGAISNKCTSLTCPVMNAGSKYVYRWADGEKIVKPIKLSAPEYVEHLMLWIERKITDEAEFPIENGAEFPKHFHRLVCTIFKRMFRVFAHIYRVHFDDIVEMGSEATLNTSFKHFIYFVDEYQLVTENELEPLSNLVKARLNS